MNHNTALMTPRQRWLALLDGRSADRVPTDYWATPEFNAKLMTHLGCKDGPALWEQLKIDAPLGLGPKRMVNRHEDEGGDMWGQRGQAIEYGTGTYFETTHHPLAGAQSPADVHAHRWPQPEDFDYRVIGERLDQLDGTRLVRAGGYEPFMLYCGLRGMEQAFEDLVLEPEIADAILGHIFDFCYEHNRRIFEAGRGRIDMFYLAEDLGGQTGPLFSVEMYRRFFMPNQLRMADLCRSHGIHVFYHTDGSARPFLPDLIDVVGIEVLNPLQWCCPGMELEALARDFGDRVVFHGGIDNQHTLPFGSPQDVRDQVREVADILSGCRWVCAPCHNIQPVTPVENVIAMYEAATQLNGG